MSIPESFTIYHGDNLFSNGHGPDGVFTLLGPGSQHAMQKQLLGPQYLSFQQVRRWILDMFKVDEATHELVLRHIVVHKPKNQARPYSIVVDIVGLDSWRTFLELKRRQSEPKALYVQWHAKAAPGPVGVEGMVGEKDGTTPAPAPVPTPVTAAEDPAVADQHGGSWPSCKKHGKPCSIETSWDREDPGRRFYCCPLFKNPGMDCGFTRWLDKKFPKNATKHINSLLSTEESLEQDVEDLKAELDELRRRYVIGSSHCAPRDGQDSQGRPRKVRKLA